MCGIVGFSCSSYSSSLTELNLRSALSALIHRGPDDSGLHIDSASGIGLAHARLSILDLSSLGHQPFFSKDGRVAIIFNGEIYNFRELRTELEFLGHTFFSNSDTEVLLNLYLDWRARGGDLHALLRRLNGIFCFALWDADRDAMLLVRDALGVKPLYYSTDNGLFAFASELKALLPLFETFGALNPVALNRYQSFLWNPGEDTPVSNVSKLGPGELLWVRAGNIERKERWYQLPIFRYRSLQMDEAAAVSGTLKALRSAVHRQMVADVPVGAFLSGGLDSSSVVAFAREKNPDIRCYTIQTTGKDSEGITNDLPYALRVSKHLQVPLEVVRIDGARMAEDLSAMVAQLDEPLADPASLNVLYISRLARDQGIRVLLSGTGGDDIFTGYRRHSALMREDLWSWLPKFSKIALRNFTAKLDQRRTLFRRMRKLFSGASLDSDARLVNYFRWVDQKDLKSLYTAEFSNAIGDALAEEPMIAFLAELPKEASRLERMLALEQRFFLADHNLIYTDKMSMAVGVEVRVPFLDLELVEFAAQIPAHFKQRGKEGKWILKKAMEAYLPYDVIYRSKSGFGAPLRRWMRVELRELLADVLSTQSLHKRGLFDPVAVQRMINQNDQGKIDASYTLLSLMCIELWCRRFIDRRVEVPQFQEK